MQRNKGGKNPKAVKVDGEEEEERSDEEWEKVKSKKKEEEESDESEMGLDDVLGGEGMEEVSLTGFSLARWR